MACHGHSIAKINRALAICMNPERWYEILISSAHTLAAVEIIETEMIKFQTGFSPHHVPSCSSDSIQCEYIKQCQKPPTFWFTLLHLSNLPFFDKRVDELLLLYWLLSWLRTVALWWWIPSPQGAWWFRSFCGENFKSLPCGPRRLERIWADLR